MFTAIMYLLDFVVLTVFCYKTYTIAFKAKTENKFAKYIFWSALFVDIAFLVPPFFIFAYTIFPQQYLMFLADIVGRALFYIGAVFGVQIPLYKSFPNSKKRIIFSYLAILIGIALLIYQISYNNYPYITDVGIINWQAGAVLTSGMSLLFIVPWAVTSFIFIKEFIKSKFSSPKTFLLGFGFILICVGAVFQDATSTILSFILLGIPLIAGFMLLLAGLYYDKEK